MHYVKHFNVLGVDAAQIPCIELQGIPTTATEGAVGVLGVNMASADHEIYICVGVKGTVYTWIPLKGDGGVTITKAEVNEIGELIITLSNSAEINAGVVAGSGCFVNGVATDVNFTANPQDQIDGCVKKAGDTVEGQLLLPNSPTTPDEGTVTNAYTTRKTANSDMTGLEVVDGSATHIQEIVGSTVKCKNIFDINTTPHLSYPTYTTYSVDGDTVTFISTLTNNKFYYKLENVLEVGKIYTFSVDSIAYTGNALGIWLGTTNAIDSNEYSKRIETPSGSITFTATSTDLYIKAYINYALATSGQTIFTFSKPMLVEGSQVLPYQSYFKGLKNANINSIVSTGKNLFSLDKFMEVQTSPTITRNGEDLVVYNQGYQEKYTVYNFPVVLNTATMSLECETTRITGNASFAFRFIYEDGTLERKMITLGQVGNIQKIIFSTKNVVAWAFGDWQHNGTVILRNIQIQVGDTATEYEPYIEPNIYQLPKTVELGEFDKLLPQEGKLVKQTGYATSATGFTDEQITSYDSAIVSSDKKSLVYKLSTTQVTKMDIPKNYTVYHGGTETIVQGEVDNSEYGAIPTITQTYAIHENPKEVAIKEYVNNALAKKLDKTGGTITGNLVVEGKTDTALGAVISKQGDVIYGLAYENEAYKLGQGEIDENGDFSFNEGEGLPIALRDDSSTFTDGNFVCWNAEKNKLVDSGKNPSTLVTKKWKHTITISGTKTSQLADSNGSSHIVTLNYELTVDRFSTRSTQMKSLLEIRDYCSNTKGVGVCQLTVKDFDDSSVEYINDLETVTIGAIDGGGNMRVKGLFVESTEHNQGLTVSRISFAIGSNDSVTITDSVYEI